MKKLAIFRRKVRLTEWLKRMAGSYGAALGAETTQPWYLQIEPMSINDARLSLGRDILLNMKKGPKKCLKTTDLKGILTNFAE
jgi:hypothetical protein